MCANVAARTLRAGHAALVGRDRRTAAIGAGRNGVDCRASCFERDGLCGTTVALKPRWIQQRVRVRERRVRGAEAATRAVFEVIAAVAYQAGAIAACYLSG